MRILLPSYASGKQVHCPKSYGQDGEDLHTGWQRDGVLPKLLLLKYLLTSALSCGDNS